MQKRILIVDDERSIRTVLRGLLAREGYEVEVAEDGGGAITALGQDLYHAVITDLKMPGIGGLELLAWIKANDPGLPVIILTAHGTVDNAVEAMKLGAYDYITKPFDRDELRRIVEKALRAEEARSVQLASGRGRFDIIGTVPSMRRVFQLIEKVAASPTTALVLGESGTGKELVARALHDNSPRRDGPFIVVNCSAVPEELFESELFGHERGAFTGAISARPGRFELADGGTLFLDEIGELPLSLQPKLLRAIQERAFERVGGTRTLSVDVRLVAATNRDLPKMIQDGGFREDLYYRLNVIPVQLPPLRERSEDIPHLVEHFIERFNERLGRDIQGVSEAAMAVLQRGRWPGNIRELENLMERAVLLAEGERLELVDVAPFVDVSPEAPPDAPPVEPEGLETLPLKDYVRVHTARLERARIAAALSAENQNVTRAAQRLGISRKSLQNKMKEYRLRGGPSNNS